MILRSHGLLTVGVTIAQAFLYMFNLQRACEIQIAAQSSGAELIHVDQRIVAGVRASVAAVTRGLGSALAWPALLRKLDRIDPSFRQ
jgi:ribulose-5-phosphate 4-epimerase/fuculose-1-phosphate aldolase